MLLRLLRLLLCCSCFSVVSLNEWMVRCGSFVVLLHCPDGEPRERPFEATVSACLIHRSMDHLATSTLTSKVFI